MQAAAQTATSCLQKGQHATVLMTSDPFSALAHRITARLGSEICNLCCSFLDFPEFINAHCSAATAADCLISLQPLLLTAHS